MVPKPLVKRKALVPATLCADLMEWGTAGLHGSEQVADINRNARPTSSALGVRMKSIVSIPPATNARTVLGSVSIRRFDVKGTKWNCCAPPIGDVVSGPISR